MFFGEKDTGLDYGQLNKNKNKNKANKTRQNKTKNKKTKTKKQLVLLSLQPSNGESNTYTMINPIVLVNPNEKEARYKQAIEKNKQTERQIYRLKKFTTVIQIDRQTAAFQ